MLLKKFYTLIFLFLLLSNANATPNKMTEEQFGDYLFNFVVNEYKEKEFKKSDDSLMIISGELQLGLESLFKKYIDSESSMSEFNPIIKEHFDTIFSQFDASKKLETINWEEAKRTLRPMFAPISYAEKLDIIHSKIDSNAISTYVLDNEKGYRYVSNDDLKKWGVSVKKVKKYAEKNLGESSKNTPMQGSLDKVKFLAVQSYDGYDAARLLVPEFRDFVASKLGYPFYAGIPNRDFLIMWSIDNPDKMKSGFANSIESDFREKPYPLTPNVLEVSKENISILKR